MVTLLLMILLVFGFFIGLKRGFIMQVLHLVSFIAAFVFAILYYDELAPRLALWVPYPDLNNDSAWADFLQALPLEGGFYNAIAFAIIFFAVKLILQIIASMLDFIADLPVLHSINSLFGGLLGFIEMYLLIFIVLYILALTPLENVQAWVNSSSLALFIVEHTPVLSEQIKHLWFDKAEELVMNNLKKIFSMELE